MIQMLELNKCFDYDAFTHEKSKSGRCSFATMTSSFQVSVCKFWPEKFEFTNGSFELFCQVLSFQFGITIFCILSNGVPHMYQLNSRTGTFSYNNIIIFFGS